MSDESTTKIDNIITVDIKYDDQIFSVDAFKPPGGRVEIWCIELEEDEPLHIINEMPNKNELSLWADGYIKGHFDGHRSGMFDGIYSSSLKINKEFNVMLDEANKQK